MSPSNRNQHSSALRNEGARRHPQQRSAVVHEDTVKDYGNQSRQEYYSLIDDCSRSGSGSHSHDADTLEPPVHHEHVELKEQPMEQRIMKKKLRNEMCQEDTEQTKRFIPKDALRRICHYEAVLEVLLAHQRFKGDENEAKACAEYVCGPNNQRQPDAKSSARQIFGILVCLAEVCMISDFRKSKIFDDDLPLRSNQNQGKLWSRKSKEEDCLKFMTDNKLINQDFFDRQWQFHVPDIIQIQYRDRSNITQGPFAQNYEIDAETVLPWTEKTLIGEGAFGTVFRLRIHQDHHNLGYGPDGTDNRFALKVIKSGPSYESSSQAKKVRRLFEMELDAFRRNLESPHVVYLCATFRRGKEYMFIMPWAAKGNLANLLSYKQNPPTLRSSSRAERIEFMEWIYKQCAGLVGGLACIHDKLKNAPMDDLDPEDEKLYGVHSDIKPENILHFDDETNPGEYGILKLADFGLLKYHTYDTKTHALRDVAIGPRQPIYAAPELVYDSTISRTNDIWAFGCVFSEILTWAIKGADSIENFRDRRLEELRIDPLGRTGSWQDDRFFICHPTVPLNSDSTVSTMPERKNEVGGAPLREPELKKSVSNWIGSLEVLAKGEGPQTFVQEFLETVRDRMLDVRYKKRISCEEMVKFFKACKEKGQNDEGYWLIPEGISPEARDERPHKFSASTDSGGSFPSYVPGVRNHFLSLFPKGLVRQENQGDEGDVYQIPWTQSAVCVGCIALGFIGGRWFRSS